MVDSRAGKIAAEVAEQCMASRLRRVSRMVTRAYDDALRGFGITANQLTMLAAIEAVGVARQVDLVEVLDMEKSTVSRNVKRMVKRGWLAEKHAADGRAAYELSAGGRATLVAAYPAWRGAQRGARLRVGAAAMSALSKVVGEPD